MPSTPLGAHKTARPALYRGKLAMVVIVNCTWIGGEEEDEEEDEEEEVARSTYITWCVCHCLVESHGFPMVQPIHHP